MTTPATLTRLNASLKRARRVKHWIERLAILSMFFDYAIAILTYIGNNVNDLTITISSGQQILSNTTIDLGLAHAFVNYGIAGIMTLTTFFFILWLGLKYENGQIERMYAKTKVTK